MTSIRVIPSSDRMEEVISKAVAESSDAVASSANNTGVLCSRHRAMEMRCRSPPERELPFSPHGVSAPRAVRRDSSPARRTASAVYGGDAKL